MIVHSGGYVAYQRDGCATRAASEPSTTRRPRTRPPTSGRSSFDCLTHDRQALEFLLARSASTTSLMGTDLPCDMATPAPWNELVAVAGEAMRCEVAETNIDALYGAPAPAA